MVVLAEFVRVSCVRTRSCADENDSHVECFVRAAWVHTPPHTRDAMYRLINDRKLFGRTSNSTFNP